MGGSEEYIVHREKKVGIFSEQRVNFVIKPRGVANGKRESLICKAMIEARIDLGLSSVHQTFRDRQPPKHQFARSLPGSSPNLP